jgi:hypothetical protein
VRDIADKLSVNVVVQFMRLWMALRGFTTGVGVEVDCGWLILI